MTPERKEEIEFWYRVAEKVQLIKYVHDLLAALEDAEQRLRTATEETRYQKGVTEDYAKGYRLQELRAIASEFREQGLKQSIEKTLNECEGEPDYFLAKKISAALATLYPDTPAPKEDSHETEI